MVVPVSFFRTDIGRRVLRALTLRLQGQHSYASTAASSQALMIWSVEEVVSMQPNN